MSSLLNVPIIPSKDHGIKRYAGTFTADLERILIPQLRNYVKLCKRYVNENISSSKT